MEDRLENGKKVRTLNIIDDCNREPLTIEIQHSFPSETNVMNLRKVFFTMGLGLSVTIGSAQVINFEWVKKLGLPASIPMPTIYTFRQTPG